MAALLPITDADKEGRPIILHHNNIKVSPPAGENRAFVFSVDKPPCKCQNKNSNFSSKLLSGRIPTKKSSARITISEPARQYPCLTRIFLFAKLKPSSVRI